MAPIDTAAMVGEWLPSLRTQSAQRAFMQVVNLDDCEGCLEASVDYLLP